MKNTITTLLILGLTTSLWAQQSKIIVQYDGNGNRILRKKVTKTVPRPAPNQSNESTGNSAHKIALEKRTSEKDLIRIKVYPNPTSGLFTIDIGNLSLLEKPCFLIVTDESGRRLMKQRVQTLQSHYDLSQSADGVYMITVVAGNKKKTFRLIKRTK